MSFISENTSMPCDCQNANFVNCTFHRVPIDISLYLDQDQVQNRVSDLPLLGTIHEKSWDFGVSSLSKKSDLLLSTLLIQLLCDNAEK
jgi:hypothetical protein